MALGVLPLCSIAFDRLLVREREYPQIHSSKMFVPHTPEIPNSLSFFCEIITLTTPRQSKDLESGWVFAAKKRDASLTCRYSRAIERFARRLEVVSRPARELKRPDAEDTLESPFQMSEGN